MHKQIMDLLLKEEEIGWKTIIYDMVKSGEIDPWDVNVTTLTKKYIEIVKRLQEHDLKVSGKVILAAALLLRIKSSHLIDNDIARLDSLMNASEDLEEFEEQFYENKNKQREKGQYTLIPRNPQPRNRKVSVQDLVNALQRAMISKKRVLEKIRPEKFSLPQRRIDIMEIIHDMVQKINYYSSKKENLTFTKLLPPRASKQDKVYTFIPLLHLENQRKVEMKQKEAFDEIHVTLEKKN
jgi:segregation and condensation protein A